MPSSSNLQETHCLNPATFNSFFFSNYGDFFSILKNPFVEFFGPFFLVARWWKFATNSFYKKMHLTPIKNIFLKNQNQNLNILGFGPNYKFKTFIKIKIK
jgi:hypothetical protein